MPTKARHPCSKPGCPNLVAAGGYCDLHKKKARRSQKEYDKQRGSSAKRGYGGTWQKLRTIVLNKKPLCADPYGIHEQSGRIELATEVDHIIPKRDGGTNEMKNLQPLCKSCHSRKTVIDTKRRRDLKPSKIPATIVTGPPGSGKTTFVNKEKRWGDLVVDVDALYSALCGFPWYEKPLVLLPFVIEARDSVIRRLSRPSEVRHAWIITTEADVSKLKEMKIKLAAEALIVLEVDAIECIRRIHSDERRKDLADKWTPLVHDWWNEYRATSL